MDLKLKIQEDMKSAMKAGDPKRVSTLRMAIAEVKKKEIDKRAPLEEAEIFKVLNSLIKQRIDSASAFRSGNRLDLAENEEQEIEVLKAYLPQALSPEEVISLVKGAIAEVGATSSSQLGAVMKLVLPKVAGRADGKLVSDTVKQLLS